MFRLKPTFMDDFQKIMLYIIMVVRAYFICTVNFHWSIAKHAITKRSSLF